MEIPLDNEIARYCSYLFMKVRFYDARKIRKNRLMSWIWTFAINTWKNVTAAKNIEHFPFVRISVVVVILNLIVIE